MSPLPQSLAGPHPTPPGAGPAGPAAERYRRQARQAAEQFESFFLARFIDSMQEGIETNGPFGGGHAEEMFRGLFSDAVAKQVARAGGIGVADSVYREMMKLQEGSGA
ncbi:MAG TPA: rod-binding protein [Alphaproteobacteria bacterium]|nr:rod-binding protein [Alphaproteobacteria bacterium]